MFVVRDQGRFSVLGRFHLMPEADIAHCYPSINNCHLGKGTSMCTSNVAILVDISGFRVCIRKEQDPDPPNLPAKYGRSLLCSSFLAPFQAPFASWNNHLLQLHSEGTAKQRKKS